MKHKRSIKVTLLAVVLLVALLAPSMAVNADEPEWEALSPMSEGRRNFHTEVIDGKIYAIAGYELSSMEVYNPATDTWTTLSPMAKISGFQTEVLDGKIYTIGGYASNNVYLSSAQVYDPATDTWTAIASMTSARRNFQTEVIDGKIYAIGGTDGHGLDSTEVYDPNTDTWTTLAPMSKQRINFQTEVVDGKIYAIAGSPERTSMEAYDPGSDTWTTLAPLPEEHSRGYTAAINGKIYVIGENTSESVKVYDPETDEWTILATMPFKRSFAGKAIIDGEIYLVGGSGQDGELASTEVYNTNTDTWTTLAPLVLARRNVETEVINGTIYAIGGYYDGAALPLVERYTVTSSGSSVPASPANLTATAGDAQVSLSWDAVSGADSYTVMRATVSGGPYTAIATDVTTTTYTDTDVTNGNTYYYVVTAVNNDGESTYSNEASATPTASAPAYSALLRVTMVTGEIKEYEMDSAQIGDFLSWCDGEGAGSPAYTITKDYNLGPFSARDEYILYDKISSYEVLRYD